MDGGVCQVEWAGDVGSHQGESTRMGDVIGFEEGSADRVGGDASVLGLLVGVGRVTAFDIGGDVEGLARLWPGRIEDAFKCYTCRESDPWLWRFPPTPLVGEF